MGPGFFLLPMRGDDGDFLLQTSGEFDCQPTCLGLHDVHGP